MQFLKFYNSTIGTSIDLFDLSKKIYVSKINGSFIVDDEGMG